MKVLLMSKPHPYCNCNLYSTRPLQLHRKSLPLTLLIDKCKSTRPLQLHRKSLPLTLLIDKCKSTRPLQLHRKSLPLTLLIDKCKLLLWLQIHRYDNVVLQTMSVLTRNEFKAVCSKYSRNVDHTPGKMNNMIWDNLSSTVLIVFNVFRCIFYTTCLIISHFTVYLCMFVCILCAGSWCNKL